MNFYAELYLNSTGSKSEESNRMTRKRANVGQDQEPRIITSSATKQSRSDHSSGNWNQGFECSKKTQDTVTTRSDDHEEHVPFIDISKKDRSSPMLNARIIPETGTNEPEDIVVTLSVPRSPDDLAKSMPDLCRQLADAIQAKASGIFGDTLDRNKESDPNHQPGSKVSGSGIEVSSSNGPREFITQPIRSKRPISEVINSDYDTTVRVGVGPIGMVSPPFRPLEMKYLLLEELLMADEVWNKQPKQAYPLTGSSFVDMTVEDHYHLMHYIYTRQLVKHLQLSAVRRMPLVDQLVVMKTKVRCAAMAHCGIVHNWRKRLVMIDYPGSPILSEDVPRALSADSYKRLRKYAKTYPDRCRDDKTLTLILCAMALFDNDPDTIENLTSAGRNHYEVYSWACAKMLKEHLESKYSKMEAAAGYSHLLTWLNCINLSVGQTWNLMQFDVDPSTFDICSLRITSMKGNDE